MNIQLVIVGITIVIIGLVEQCDVGPCTMCHQYFLQYDDARVTSNVGVPEARLCLGRINYLYTTIFSRDGRSPSTFQICFLTMILIFKFYLKVGTPPA